MRHDYFLPSRLLRWLRRFRKRRGYGVHSPLAFDFITDVIYNAGEYYAYDRLRQPLVASLSRLDEYDPASGLTAKDLRLLFRLANYEAPSRLALCGGGATVRDYIRAARTTAEEVSLGLSSDEDDDTSSRHDAAAIQSILPAGPGHPVQFFYCDAVPTAAPAAFLACLSQEGSMCVVRGIHRDAAAAARWQALAAHPAATLTFDLCRFGIILIRPKVNKQAYVVNYF